MRRQWPDPRTSLGRRTWPHWRGWKHCAVTGDLIGPDGYAWTPEKLEGAAWLMQCWDLRNRLIFADSEQIQPLLTSRDMLPRQRAVCRVTGEARESMKRGAYP